MKRLVHCTLAALALFSAAAQGADESGEKAGEKTAARGTPDAAEAAKMESLRQKLKTDKRYIVSHNMDLSDAEAKRFWPLYDAYQKDLDKLNDRIQALVSKYLDANQRGSISDDVARKLVSDSLDIDKAEVDLERAHLAKVSKVLPPSKVVRYAQIENKLRALVRYELASAIPMAN